MAGDRRGEGGLAAPELLSEGGSIHPSNNPPNQKPPLSDYERALLEGKSHLEALYAQFTPTPQELERRKRENEELRRASAAAQAEPPFYLETGFSQPGSIPSAKYYGPCPAPLAAPKPLGVGGYSWHGHRPLDRWKVHTA